jgi:hypothetical protein
VTAFTTLDFCHNLQMGRIDKSVILHKAG